MTTHEGATLTLTSDVGTTGPALEVAPLQREPVVSYGLGTRRGWPMRLSYLAGDLIAIIGWTALAGWIACWISGSSLFDLTAMEPRLFGFLAIGLLLVAHGQRTYAAVPPRPVRQFRGWVIGSLTVLAFELAAIALLHPVASALLPALLIVATLLSILSASFHRALCRSLFGKRSWWGTRLLIVGNGGLAREAFAALHQEPQWGLRPAGLVDEDDETDLDEPRSLRARVNKLAIEQQVDRAMVVVHAFDSEELAELMSRGDNQIQHWIIVPYLGGYPSLWLEACEAARLPALEVTNHLARPSARRWKRALDLICGGLIALACLPLICVIALLIRATSPGPIFYAQERLSRRGRRFRAWKFRSMWTNADAVLSRYLADNPALEEEWKANHKLKRDPRVTGIGKLLRMTSLDELPQIWNVLVGDMSLVGPRPIVLAEIQKYGEHYEQYCEVLPGITGLWQVSGRNNTTYERRVELDAYYVQNWSVWLDLYILACTVKVVLLGEGAY